MQSISFKSSLTPFESDRSAMSLDVSGQLRGSRLDVSYELAHPALAAEGLAALDWEPGESLFCETLWKRSCFELFLADSRSPRYWEWNFTPQGRWAAFSFDGVRCRVPQGARLDGGLVSIHSQLGSGSKAGRLRLDITIDLSFSPLLSWISCCAPGSLHISLNAITQLRESGEGTHWALRHASKTAPDFHRTEAFVALDSLRA